MGKKIMNKVSGMLAKVLPFMLPSTVLGQDILLNRPRLGYGALAQDPDEIMEYGHVMMRYGFDETGKVGKSGRYLGYDRYLDAETVKELNIEQQTFIKATESLRYTVYEKELSLKLELIKKEPDVALVMAFQNELSEHSKKLERKMIEHILRMKKIHLENQKNETFLSKGESYVVESQAE
jgi:hypothetical protein